MCLPCPVQEAGKGGILYSAKVFVIRDIYVDIVLHTCPIWKT